ncbi:MAG: polysaccharide deacetylase family protein [Candidatus Eremiobacter antarcticus]|nr:polysaccharide deacetylase family protein [Candidatus Eremiobacteraeota bacterium]MBC5808915.1 polysaccharide deacetylase family protein [Candidatus Eremiobacteraeota bacterium]
MALAVIAVAVVAGSGARAQARAARPDRLSAIYMYHHVSPLVLPGRYQRALTMTPDEFDAQLAWLKRRHCRLLTVDGMLSDVRRLAARAPACEVALTFDDGYEDAATFAFPALRRYHDVASFYIITGKVGAQGHVTAAQIRALRAAGMEIGAHTVHHYDLTRLTSAKGAREIGSSRTALEHWIGAPVLSFAYPSGRFNAAVVAEARAAHVRDAVTTVPGFVGSSTDPLLLPRYRMLHGKGLALFRATLGPPQGEHAKGWHLLQSLAPLDRRTLAGIARKRIAGNAPQRAEAICIALLERRFPEQILKVHLLAMQPAAVAGILLSGVKFHEAMNARRFRADVRSMVRTAFLSDKALDEVDVWATVPIAVGAGLPVSGDFAVPASRTVFSTAVTATGHASAARQLTWGAEYWDADWTRDLTPAKAVSGGRLRRAESR